MSEIERPSNYRNWPRSAKIEYLTLGHTRAELMHAIRREIDTDRDTDRFSKSELAQITLAMGVSI